MPPKVGMGWIPEDYDPDDRTQAHAHVQPHLKKSNVLAHIEDDRPLPPAVDLRPWCPAIRFQGGFNTCAAHVVAGLLEYFERKSFGEYIEASRLFLHKVTKNFLHEQGNLGVYIRQTMGALTLIGVPPEKYWPYPETGTLEHPVTEDSRLDEEPTAFCYALAADYRSIIHYRLDARPPDTEENRPFHEGVLRVVKSHLASHIPSALGFPVYESVYVQSLKSGDLPYPAPRDHRYGNHAVLTVGYDDGRKIVNRDENGMETTGALLIHNSWSEAWGDKGYGWLPYEYVLEGRARDFWTMIKAEWLDTDPFQILLESHEPGDAPERAAEAEG
jgi:C1A family cysteine protease